MFFAQYHNLFKIKRAGGQIFPPECHPKAISMSSSVSAPDFLSTKEKLGLQDYGLTFSRPQTPKSQQRRQSRPSEFEDLELTKSGKNADAAVVKSEPPSTTFTIRKN